jgi:quercetin dioxygenase-like cupin family protein
MTRRRLTMVLAGAAAALVGVWATGSLLAQQPGFKRVPLQKQDLSIPGREVVQARAEFDQGAAVGLHTHPGEEIGYVLEGTLQLEVAGKPSTTLKAGDAFFVPAETIHAAKNVGSGPTKVLSSYVVEKGKPLSTMVKETAATTPASK